MTLDFERNKSNKRIVSNYRPEYVFTKRRVTKLMEASVRLIHQRVSLIKISTSYIIGRFINSML